MDDFCGIKGVKVGVGIIDLSSILTDPNSLLKSDKNVLDIIQTKEDAFIDGLEARLEQKDPFNKYIKLFESAEKKFNTNDHSLDNIRDCYGNFKDFITFAEKPFSGGYWEKHLQKLSAMEDLLAGRFRFSANTKSGIKERKKREKKIENIKKGNESTPKNFHNEIITEWRKELRMSIEEWRLEEIERIKKAFLEEIEEWLKKLELIYNFINGFGLDTGLFLDFSAGISDFSDIELLKKWLDIIEKDVGVKAICDMLGRIRKERYSDKTERIKVKQGIKRIEKDIYANEEIVGIKLGNEIHNLVPSELSLLSSFDMEILFDLRFIESNLLCFNVEGNRFVDDEVDIYEDRPIQELESNGPIILCIDTSGSMNGPPEHVAKAVSLHMVNLARQEDRDCYLINFSTCIEVIDFSSGMSLSRLLDFLKLSFHGGTDASPAIKHALERMEGGKYEHADLLILSDFLMPDLQEDVKLKIEKARKKDNKFHSLCISNDSIHDRLRTLFDHEWVYNPATSKVTELTKIFSAPLR